MSAKHLGFVDDQLDNFHANTYLDALRGPLQDRGWTLAGVTSLAADEGAEWARKKDVPFFDTVDQLAGEVDAFAILAPSTPHTHLTLCQQVLPHGKPTFVDKVFAPNTRIAQQIFELADQCGAAIQTTSALRTTNIQRAVGELASPLVSLAQWAGGASLEEYGIHPIELAISCMGPEVVRVGVAGAADHPTIVLEFSAGRVATIDFNAREHVPFLTSLTTAKQTVSLPVEDATLFIDAMAAILDFFDAGVPLVPREETVTIMRVLDAVQDSRVRSDWITL